MNDVKITCFEDLRVWQQGQELAADIYLLTETNKFIKTDFSLKDQLKSCSISISDNIAEGFEYNNNPDYYKFLRIAKGSCGELANKLLFIKRMKFDDESKLNQLITRTKALGNQIGALLIKVKSKIITDKKTKIT